MYKYLLSCLGIFIVVVFSFFTLENPSIKCNIPASVSIGSDFTMEFTIHKGSVSLFGKLSIELPYGFIATEIDSKNGKFSFENNQCKIIWLALPSEEDFSVKIKVEVDKITLGNKNILGKFYYVDGNDKKQIDMPIHEITVTDSQKVVSIANNNQVKIDTVLSNAVHTEPAAVVTAERTITADEKTGTYKVEIKIKKSTITGFAKYSDLLPEVLVASKGTASFNGNFKFEHNAAIFIWPNLPKDEILTATYWIKLNGLLNENAEIKGVFSYLENEQTRKVNADDDVLQNLVITSAAVTTTQTPNKTEDKKEVTEIENSQVNKTLATTSTVNYHIQIGAFSNPPPTNYFASKYKISEKINTDAQQGLTKFLIGEFVDYKDSRNYRDNIKGQGVSDAFVAAYNSGKRITVQEALMLTKQNWFK